MQRNNYIENSCKSENDRVLTKKNEFMSKVEGTKQSNKWSENRAFSEDGT